MLIRLPYQHLGERAIYETPAPAPDPANPDSPPYPTDPGVDPPDARPDPPLEVRPARASRLVFSIEAEDTILFSTDGILAAMGRLAMIVHPLATPKPVVPPTMWPGPIVVLPGGVEATLSADGVAMSKATAAAVRRTDPVTQFRNLRHTRTILSTRHGVATRAAVTDEAGPSSIVVNGVEQTVASLFGRGGLVISPDRIVVRPRPRWGRSAAPRQLETAIEAPFRLVISPSALGGWTHAMSPSPGGRPAPGRALAYPTRRPIEASASTSGEHQRAVRAIWARDPTAPRLAEPHAATDDKRPSARRSTAATGTCSSARPRRPGPARQNTSRPSRSTPRPVAVGARRLARPPRRVARGRTRTQLASILRGTTWRRWARPVRAGRLSRLPVPVRRTALVKITERKMKDAAPSTAGLYQRKFLVPASP